MKKIVIFATLLPTIVIIYTLYNGYHGKLANKRTLPIIISNNLVNFPLKQEQFSAYSIPTISNSKELTMIVAATKHAWSSYRKACFGEDNLLPSSSGSGKCENWLHLSATLIDSLDTLMMMKLDDEVKECKQYIQHHFKPGSINAPISFFETTIRIVGGLLSAHSISGDIVYLHHADALTQRLLHTFNSIGWPKSKINLQTNQSSLYEWSSSELVLAEVASFQLEFLYLWKHTSNDIYSYYGKNMFNLLDNLEPPTKGLYPLFIRKEDDKVRRPTQPNLRYSWGAMGDSAYEYILKTYVLTGKRDLQLKRMYREATWALETSLLKRMGRTLFVTSYENGRLLESMDHLSCFIPGLLALGVYAQAIDDNETANRHMKIAKQLMHTCYRMYESRASGLAPEVSIVTLNGELVSGSSPAYYLRPEAIESLFILYRVTHDELYREWGWSIFQAIQRHCYIKGGTGGYAGLLNVDFPNAGHTPKMESYFIAETLKYLYLLFSDDQCFPLDEFVFNTEAHPLRNINN